MLDCLGLCFATVRGVCRSAALDVGSSPVHGRGVFTRTDIAESTLLGEWPILRIDADDVVWGSGSLVERYVFEMSDGAGAMVLGLPSLFNHASTPNCRVTLDEERLSMSVVSVAPIAAGDEILIDYGPDYWA